ncbi:uncharacterized protein PRCAT00006248001 [Priceomyces carsonii]|uniref:uncharacterized protein n=1 Tax=Priceomyces carsonii TaxID=28549 RepID=UPI002ED8C8EE|nr:unnamed protein product [Priceomyces carsonii]
MSEYGDPGTLEEDIPGRRKKVKQNELEIEGIEYESDSSLEDYQNDDKEKASEDHSDDDMFSDSSERGKPQKNRLDKEGVELLNMNNFEKEEGLEDYDDEKFIDSDANTIERQLSQGELDYFNYPEEADLKQIQKGKTFNPKLEAFNLRDESKEGNFDIDGNFIRNKQEKRDQSEDDDDVWYNDYKETDILKARKAQLERYKAQKEKRLEGTKKYADIGTLLVELLEVLQPAETPLEALARIAPKKKSKKRYELTEADKGKKAVILKVTEICESLSRDKSIDDIYSLSREELMRLYKQETGEEYSSYRGKKRRIDDEDEDDDNKEDKEEIDYGEKVWEFKWNEDNVINGPYSSYEMSHWKDTYFENNVLVKRIDQSEFVPIDNITFND